MSVAFRVVALLLVVSFLAAGPFAPLVAAQQPAQPDTFKETMKDQPATREGEVQMGDRFNKVFAGVATGFLVPGRVITCTIGTGVSMIVLLLTFGTQYRAAAGVLNEGCGGKWIVKPEDIASASNPPIMGPGDKRY
jgi:hypothetical protein